MMNPKELLARAADEMSKVGMAKRSYSQTGEQTSPVCAYGALTRAATQGRTADYSAIGFHPISENIKKLIDQAAELLASEIRATESSLVSSDEFSVVTKFNDRDTTTAEDMVLHMKRAAHSDS